MTIKKVIRYILLGLICSFVIFIILSNILAHIFGFKKVDAFFPHVHYPICYFKKSASQEITIDSVYKNVFNDSVYIFNYADLFKISLWVINQNSLVNFSTVIDTSQKWLKPEAYYPYESLLLSRSNINRKAFNMNLQNVSISFNKCQDIQNIINSKNCQYYYLKAGAIFLTSGANNYYDIFLGLNNSMHSDFMAYSVNNKLYLIVLYAPTKGDITSDDLKNIINFPLI